jgi:hypothetical protein
VRKPLKLLTLINLKKIKSIKANPFPNTYNTNSFLMIYTKNKYSFVIYFL